MQGEFFKTKIIDRKKMIFDPIRKKFILLTPEELVRQKILAYMVEIKNYPISLISVEKQIQVLGMAKRFDIVVFDRSFSPLILVECKQSQVKLSQKTMEQASLYNLKLKVPYIVITNGETNFVIKVDLESGQYEFLADLPSIFDLKFS